MITPSRRATVAGGLALGLAAHSSKAGAQEAGSVGGWREAVVIVADLKPWIETLTTVGGWEVVTRTRPNTDLNALWSLPAEARTTQALMRNIGTTRGYIRLVQVEHAPQVRIRPDDQAWETGGVQALDIRVLQMEATRAALQARGWRAPSDPVRYKAYNVEVVQWAPSSPDGVRLSFIQRISPPLQGWPEIKRWSRVANAAITTKDVAVADAFFRNILGMGAGGVTNTVGTGANVLGLPWALSKTMPVDIRGFKDPKGVDNAVELISMPAAQGRDYAADARPPNLGIAALRFFVSDAPSLAKRLAAQGVTIAAPLQSIRLAPYGDCRVFAALAPDGVWLEFIEQPA